MLDPTEIWKKCYQRGGELVELPVPVVPVVPPIEPVGSFIPPTPDPVEPAVPDMDPDDPCDLCPDDPVDVPPRRLRFAAVAFFPEALRAVVLRPVVWEDPVPADWRVPPMPPEPAPA
jgi:hypothetical protein